MLMIALCLMVGCTVAAPTPADLELDNVFVQACTDGFNRDYLDNAQAKILGQGTCSLLVSGEEPPLRIAPSGEDYGDVPRRTLDQVVKELPEIKIREYISTTWFSWTDGTTIYLALSAPMERAEKYRIMEVTSGQQKEDSWWACTTWHLVGKTDWVKRQRGDAHLTQLQLGQPGPDPKKTLGERFKQLKDLLVLE